VSVITALNVHKDEINRLGTSRFANETSQQLVDFFSEDIVASSPDDQNSKPFGRRKKPKVKQTKTILSDRTQEILWNQPPSANDKCIPGKLSLCIGMPVIIRTNTATELCITRGQEALVHSWQSSKGSRGQNILEVLLVELQNPPQPIQIDGLPINVIPLTRTSSYIVCSLPDDQVITLNRTQVEVLPNFAMTDYSSQGKTRPYNPVDLNNCRSHQSYYTVLSRSASAAGTCIVQGFDSRMMTGGSSGALRQEFRELELLDDIGCLRYENKLNSSVVGDNRRCLIQCFRQWKGDAYNPPHVHKALRWGKDDPFQLHSVDMNLGWSIVETSKAKPENRKACATQPDSQSIIQPSTVLMEPVHGSCAPKRKLDASHSSDYMESSSTAKKMKRSADNTVVRHPAHLQMPLGMVWSNNSCAYDCVLSIMHTIWSHDSVRHSDLFRSVDNNFLIFLADKFNQLQKGVIDLEDIRDDWRHLLTTQFPTIFRWG
jgi:hypothetical protein